MEKSINIKILIASGSLIIFVALLLGWVATNGLGEKFLTQNQQTSEANDMVETGMVSRIINGDTIELSDKRRVHYIGLVAPKDGCFSSQAIQKNKDLVLNKNVRLEKDGSNRDKSGRLLRYVYVDVEDREIMVNGYLLSQGFARPLNVPPDLKFEKDFNSLAGDAKFQDRGLWSQCQ